MSAVSGQKPSRSTCRNREEASSLSARYSSKQRGRSEPKCDKPTGNGDIMTQSTAEIESVETRTSSTGWLRGTRVPGSSVATSRPATCSMHIGGRSSAQTRFSPSRLRTQRWPGGRRGCLETGGSILSAKVSCTCLPRLPVTPDISTQRARSRDHRWQAMDVLDVLDVLD